MIAYEPSETKIVNLKVLFYLSIYYKNSVVQAPWLLELLSLKAFIFQKYWCHHAHFLLIISRNPPIICVCYAENKNVLKVFDKLFYIVNIWDVFREDICRQTRSYFFTKYSYISIKRRFSFLKLKTLPLPKILSSLEYNGNLDKSS